MDMFTAGLSNLALFDAEMFAKAYKITSMADRGILPSVFQMRSRFDMPLYGILLGLTISSGI